jgi:hypothetical protein
MEAEQIAVKAYCNILAIEKGLDPAGYAGSFDDALVMEIPLPWKKSLYEQANPLPQEMIDLMAMWLEHYKQTGEYRHRPLLIAPDEEYSREGFHRVMFYTRLPGNISQFDKMEYSVPVEEMGRLIWALYQAREELHRFEQYRVPESDTIRDILVCTHGTVDAACAKFGYPLHRHLRENYASDNLRVWRVSHFGGHVFAPTLMDMPTGHYWAYIEESQARQIVERSGGVGAMRGHYRGWAGLLSGFLQVAERELWQEYGWEWYTYRKSGEILAQDSDKTNPTWADVQITFELPDGKQQTRQMRVEVRNHIETISTTGNSDTHRYSQYRVTNNVPV